MALPLQVPFQLRTRLVLALLAPLASGCPADEASEPSGAALQRQALGQVSVQVVRPSLEAFSARARPLAAAVEAWRAAVGAEEATALAAAQAEFRAAFLAWQRVELFRFGPLGGATQVTMGEGLRDEVYSWPQVSTCRVDTALAGGALPDDAGFDAALATSKGLAVLEYLLYQADARHSCPANATIETSGSWAALSPAELGARRKAYASGVARHLERTARRALEAWDGYAPLLARAGTVGSLWRTPKDGLDDVFAGLFYVDRFLRDGKVGAPAGLNAACLKPSCPELAESPFARLSTPALVANLEALRAGFTGSFEAPSEAPGFDDLLAERGAAALRDEMLGHLDGSLALARELPDSVQALAVGEAAPLRTLFLRLKSFTDLLKSQFITTLSIRVPQEGAGDND